MRHFLLLLVVGTVAVGYAFRDDLESAWSQWRSGGSSLSLGAMGSLGRSLDSQFERFGQGIDSLGH